MRFLPAILTVCCLWGGASAPAGPASAPAASGGLSAADRARAEKLIRQMGDESFRRRESAYKRLGEMGPAILPLLRAHRNHADAEIAARIESLMKLVGWTTRGALVVRMLGGTQAWPLGFRRGDVVVKIDDDDIVGSTELVAYDHSRPRTAYIWREGKIITKKLAPGKIGIYIRNWDHDAGGAAHARGLAAAVAGRYEQAYRLLLKAEKHWTDDPWTKHILVGLAEYNLDHKRAMGLLGDLHGPAFRAMLPDLGVSPTAPVDEDLRGLPFTSAYSAWLLEQFRNGPRSRGLRGAMTSYFLDVARNYPMARKLAPPSEMDTREYMALLSGRHAGLRMAFHQRDWVKALRCYRAVAGADPRPSREAVMASVYAGDLFQAAAAATRLIHASVAGEIGSGDAGYALTAAVAALAAGRADISRGVFGKVGLLKRHYRAALVSEDVRYLFSHMAVNEMMAERLRVMATGGADETARAAYVYLDTLRFARSTTPAKWRRKFAAHGDDAGKWQPKYNHWLNAETLLRFGQYAQARQAVKKFFPKYGGLAAFHKAADFLQANARRLETDWAALKGVTQMYDGRAKGSHWTVRYDGRTFHIDPAGKIHEFPGLAPGEIHRSICGDAILLHPTGTIYCRRSQIYLLDEKARRWVRTFVSPCRVPAYASKLDDATGPVVLKYVLEHFPAAGPGREMKFREKAPGDWRLYHFNGDLVIAVQLGTSKVIDLGREIGRLAGKPQRVAVYRVHVKTPTPLIPTDAGLWTMAADGKLSRVTLDPKRPNVHVSILRWPKRPGKMHVGVAPQDGGQIYELDVKTRKVALTAGYCGLGPDDSYHWFMHDRRKKRIVPAEYAIQALYEKHLAAKRK